MYRAMWERAMDEMIEKLVLTAAKAGLTYVAEMQGCGSLRFGQIIPRRSQTLTQTTHHR